MPNALRRLASREDVWRIREARIAALGAGAHATPGR